MSPPMIALAVVVVAGAVVAVSARDGRSAVIGLLVALVLSPLVVEPLPSPLGLVARLVGGTLAAYLVRIPLRAAPLTRGSRIGWPAEGLLGAAAFVAGIAVHGFATPGLGPAAAVAAGTALAVVAAAPIVDGRDPLRQGIGLLLVVVAVDLLATGLGGTASTLRAVVVAIVVTLLGAAVAGLAARSLDATGALDLVDDRHGPQPGP